MQNPCELCLLPRPRSIRFVGTTPLSEAAVRKVPAIRLDPATVTESQGYRLSLTESGVAIVAHDEAGAYYARQTLKQILGQVAPGSTIPATEVADHPDFPASGVMLDISRDKVPTLATLKGLVDLLASWKVNQFQLYTEHTFAYPGHEKVWQNSSPLTAADIRELDAYCRERFVELVPNQNSFGHMHRWLMHPEYKHLAETPDGLDDPVTQGVKEPFSLCATDPKAAEFMGSLFDTLLPNFSSKLVNIGCDETFDLGLGRSAEACKAKGKGRVYLEFLTKLADLARSHGSRAMFWADIIHHYPELIPEVPKDMIAMEWGYWEFAAFEARCKRLADAGLDFYICPGTSTWMSFVGNTQNAIGNLRAAAHLGGRAKAKGFLNTDWGDRGHHQPLPVSYLGYAYGAAVSWAYFANQTLDLPAALSRFAFGDSAGVMGTLAYDLGNSYQYSQFASFFELITRAELPTSDRCFARATPDVLESALWHVERTMAMLPQARMARPDGDLIAREFRYAAALVSHACRLGLARHAAGAEHVKDLPGPTRAAMADELRAILVEHRDVWLARNGSGGMSDSAARIERLLNLYTQ